MTRRLRIAVRASDDIDEIAAYIARDSLRAADRIVDLFREKTALLLDFPEIGTIDSRKPDRRIHPVGNYLILYREDPDGITVLRYLHGHRDLRRIL